MQASALTDQWYRIFQYQITPEDMVYGHPFIEPVKDRVIGHGAEASVGCQLRYCVEDKAQTASSDERKRRQTAY